MVSFIAMIHLSGAAAPCPLTAPLIMFHDLTRQLQYCCNSIEAILSSSLVCKPNSFGFIAHPRSPDKGSNLLVREKAKANALVTVKYYAVEFRKTQI